MRFDLSTIILAQVFWLIILGVEHYETRLAQVFKLAQVWLKFGPGVAQAFWDAKA